MANIFKEGLDFVKSLVYHDSQKPQTTANSTPAMILPKPVAPKPQTISAPTPSKKVEIATGAGPTREASAAMKLAKQQGDTVKQVAVATKPQVSASTAKKIQQGTLNKPVQKTPEVNPIAGAKEVLGFGKEVGKAVLQVPQRALVSTAIQPVADVMGVKPVYTPKSKVEKFVFGDQPIKGIGLEVEEAQKKSQEYLASKGFNKDTAGGMSLALAPLFVGGMKALDLTPVGGEKTVTEKALANIAKSKNETRILSNLKRIVSGSEEALSGLAKTLTEVSDVKKVKSIVDDFIRPATNKEEIAAHFGTTAEDLKAKTQMKSVDDLVDNYNDLDPERVKFYEQRIKEGKEDAPIIFETADGQNIVEDGKHRLQAFKNLGYTEVPAVDGTGRVLNDKFASIGLNKFDIPAAEKEQLIKHFEEAGLPERVPQTERQWKDLANEVDVIQKVVTPEEVERANATLIKTENRIASLEKEMMRTDSPEYKKAIVQEIFELSKRLNADLSARGSALRAAATKVSGDEEFAIGKLLTKMDKAGADMDKVMAGIGDVDFNNAKSITDFYNQQVKPGFWSVLNEYRYNNMLSSPRTQSRNLLTNFAQAALMKPLTRGVEATVDAFGSLLSGKERQYYFKDVPNYYRGFFGSIPEAIGDFAKAVSEKVPIEQLDIDRMATGRLPKAFRIPTLLLEGADRFFMRVISEGEKASLLARGVPKKQAAEKAAETAKYSIFRKDLDTANKTGQGHVLSYMDKAASAVDSLRDGPLGWFVPFIKTPLNFAKQWVEYSPAGLATLPGNTKKTEQVAKMAIGSMVTLAGAQLAAQDRTTWGVPVDPEAKELFFASGKKPYSIKIGDSWVPMMYFGPGAFALALPAAMKYYQEDNPTALTDSQMKKVAKGIGSIGEFLSQQTFMEGIGNFLGMIKGDEEFNIGNTMAFTAGQTIPWQGMVRYISTIVDPVYRKADGFLEAVERDLPFLSENLEPRRLPTGEVQERNRTSYLAPYDITQEKPEYDKLLKMREEILRMNSEFNSIDKKTKSEATKLLDKFYSAEGQQDLDKIGTMLGENDNLRKAFVNLVERQAMFTQGTIEPLKMLTPKERAEIIYGRFLMAKDQKDIDQNVGEFIKKLEENDLFDDKTVNALSDLVSAKSEAENIEAQNAEQPAQELPTEEPMY